MAETKLILPNGNECENLGQLRNGFTGEWALKVLEDGTIFKWLDEMMYMGNFSSLISDMHEDYTRPQENSSHYGCEYMMLTDGKTKIRFEAGKDFSFNASEYTEEELAGKRHNFELEKCEDNVICIDYRMAGVGSNSCGPELNEKYRVPIPKLSAQFKIVLQ